MWSVDVVHAGPDVDRVQGGPVEHGCRIWGGQDVWGSHPVAVGIVGDVWIGLARGVGLGCVVVAGTCAVRAGGSENNRVRKMFDTWLEKYLIHG